MLLCRDCLILIRMRERQGADRLAILFSTTVSTVIVLKFVVVFSSSTKLYATALLCFLGSLCSVDDCCTGERVTVTEELCVTHCVLAAQAEAAQKQFEEQQKKLTESTPLMGGKQ